MLTYEENVRAVLETHFSGFKDEIIDSAVNSIMRIKTQEEKISDEEHERIENSMLALGHDLDKMAWDMSCE